MMIDAYQPLYACFKIKESSEANDKECWITTLTVAYNVRTKELVDLRKGGKYHKRGDSYFAEKHRVFINDKQPDASDYIYPVSYEELKKNAVTLLNENSTEPNKKWSDQEIAEYFRGYKDSIVTVTSGWFSLEAVERLENTHEHFVRFYMLYSSSETNERPESVDINKIHARISYDTDNLCVEVEMSKKYYSIETVNRYHIGIDGALDVLNNVCVKLHDKKYNTRVVKLENQTVYINIESLDKTGLMCMCFAIPIPVRLQGRTLETAQYCLSSILKHLFQQAFSFITPPSL